MTRLQGAFHNRRVGVWLGSLGLLTALSLPAATPTGLDTPLVVTQIPRQTRTPTATQPGSLIRADWFDGARLVLVSPQGEFHVLSEGFQSACDPNVSFDGLRMLFAGRKNRADNWRIWELGLDGQGLRPVSPENLDARSPIHVSTLFTLDSPEPWFTTVFVARSPTLNELGQPSASSLYNIKLDGADLRRLTFNPNHNFDPFQMWDGRVVYSAERYPNQPGTAAGRVGLYAIHIEGADMELYGGGGAKRIQQMPCATQSGLVVFVESDLPTGDGSGQLACLEETRPHVLYRPLTDDPAFAFLHPSPLQGSRILVSRRATGGKTTWGLIAFDTQQGLTQPVFDSPDHHDVQAVLAAPHNRPDGHSTVVETKFDSGIFYGLNAYDAEARMAPHLQTGMIQRVRLIEGLPQPATATSKTSSAHNPFIPRRLIGEAPVEADGSFNVEVPADIPLLLQTLDERGLALANCGWIWVKPKENRGCIGCHEDPERIPENHYVLALRRPSNRLILPPADRRSISFRADIAPLLQPHCATTDCHGGKKTDLHLPLTGAALSDADLRKAYSNLLAPAQREGTKPDAVVPAGRYVDPGRARTSWLVWQLTGQNTSRPWDLIEPANANDERMVMQMPPPDHGTPLRPEELRTIIQWIDMGAPFEPPATPPPPAPTP